MCQPVDIEQIINMLEIAFPNFHPKDADKTRELYWQTLRDIPTDELKAAVLNCLTEAGRAFAPSVGEIRGAVANLRSMSSNVPSSYQAWEEVRIFIRDNSYYVEPHWSHPLIEKTVRLFGLENLRQSENGMSDRMRFIQCFEQLVERAMSDEMLLPEVHGYLEINGAKLLAPLDSINLLADKLSGKKPAARGEV